MSDPKLEQVRQDIAADLAGIEFREPVIADNDLNAINDDPSLSYMGVRQKIAEAKQVRRADGEGMDRRWRIVTEAAKRAVLASPDVRRIATPMASEPLGETLPHRAVGDIAAHDEQTAGIARRMGRTLGATLELDTVPDALLVPDIRHAPVLQRRSQVVGALVPYKQDPDPGYYASKLKEARFRVEDHPGVSLAEKDLVARRYRYARDVQLLGMMAELHDQPFAATDNELNQGGNIVHRLASGAELVMAAEAYAAHPTLLDPSKWRSRKQIKDRVYSIVIDGPDGVDEPDFIIMKERKTPRHTDTKFGGDGVGLTSRQEFETAQAFAALGTIHRDGMELRWEKPLGYAELPEGNQFCLFESEPGLDEGLSVQELAQAIQAAPEAYQAEYEQTRARAAQIAEQRSDLVKTAAVYDSQEPSAELGYAEFATIKARAMVEQVEGVLRSVALEQGYFNDDRTGHAIKLRSDEAQKPVLEVIGFDFEYYKCDPGQAASKLAEMHEQARNGTAAGNHVRDICDEEGGLRPVATAAAYAILEASGKQLPPKFSALQ